MTTPLETLLGAAKALADPTRLRILALCQAGELTVSELVSILGQSQPRVSRHLRLLTEVGLLERLPEGSWVFYRPCSTGPGGALARRAAELLTGEDPVLVRDARRLAETKIARRERAGDYFRRNAADWRKLRELHIDQNQVNDRIRQLLGGRPIGRLLDVGTGTGEMLSLLSPDIENGEGVDMSPAMLGVARAYLADAGLDHCKVRQGDMYGLPFDDGAFDAAVIHQVLHYTDDARGVLAETARVLSPGGHLLVADFAPHDLENLRVEQNHRRLGYPDEVMAADCAAAGLDVKAIEHLPGDPLTVTLWLAEKPTAESAGEQ